MTKSRTNFTVRNKEDVETNKKRVGNHQRTVCCIMRRLMTFREVRRERRDIEPGFLRVKDSERHGSQEGGVEFQREVKRSQG